MKKIHLVSAVFALVTFSSAVAGNVRTVRLRLVETSDIHGSFFPYNYVERKSARGSMARISSYVEKLRSEYGENLILLDNGDIMQGQPINYYSNYVAKSDTNIVAKVLNFMRYDAAAFGNHDIETGHSVYDKMEADRGLTTDYYFQLSIFLTDMWGMDTISVFEYFVFILDNKRNADYPCF